MSTKMTKEQNARVRNQAHQQIQALPEYANRNTLFLESLGLRVTENSKLFVFAAYKDTKQDLVAVGSLEAMFEDEGEGVRMGLTETKSCETSIEYTANMVQWDLDVFAEAQTNKPDIQVTACSTFVFTHNKAGDVLEAVSLHFGGWRHNNFQACTILNNGATIIVVADCEVATVLIQDGVISFVGNDKGDCVIRKHSRKRNDKKATVTAKTTVTIDSFDPIINYDKNVTEMNKLLAKHLDGIKLTETTLCLGDGEKISDLPLVLAKDFDWSHTADYIDRARHSDNTQLTKGRVMHAYENAVFICDADKNALLYIPVYELHGADFNKKTGMVIIHGHETIHSFKLNDFSTMDLTFTR